MKSRISFFNGAIYKKDLTRFWPLWLLEFVFLQLAVTFPVYSHLLFYAREERSDLDLSTKVYQEILDYGKILTDSVLIAAVCLFMAVFLFSYLTKRRESYTVHSLPMKRETLFFSHYLSGLTMLLLPFAVTYLLTACIAASYQAGITFLLFDELAVTVVEILLFYNLACLVVMLTSNGIMTVVIYSVLNVLYVGVMYLFSSLGSIFIYGYQGNYDVASDRIGKFLTPVFTITKEYSWYFIWDHGFSRNGVDDWQAVEAKEMGKLWTVAALEDVAWYLIPALVFLMLAVVLYKKRPLEMTGDMLAYSWGRPVFRIVFTICGSLLFSMVLYGLTFGNTSWELTVTYNQAFYILLFFMVTGCILFYLISNMILCKRFFIWRNTSYVRMLLVTAAAAGMMFYVKLDGYGTKIPEAGQVEMLEIYTGEDIYSGIYNSYYIQDETQIEQFMKLQKDMIRYGETAIANDSYQWDEEGICVTYTLRDNSRIVRRYPIPAEQKEYVAVKEFMNEKETVCSKVFTPAYEDIYPSFIKILSSDGEVRETLFMQDGVGKLYQAALKDLQEGNITLMDSEQEGIEGYLEIDIAIPKSVMKEQKFSEKYLEAVMGRENGIYLVITNKCEHIIEALRESAGLY